MSTIVLCLLFYKHAQLYHPYISSQTFSKHVYIPIFERQLSTLAKKSEMLLPAKFHQGRMPPLSLPNATGRDLIRCAVFNMRFNFFGGQQSLLHRKKTENKRKQETR